MMVVLHEFSAKIQGGANGPGPWFDFSQKNRGFIEK